VSKDEMNAAPTADVGRIQSLDVMRGFAVLGILIVNAAYFAAPWQAAVNPNLPPLAVTDTGLWSWIVMHVFFEFKCITLFSLLFGASVYLVGGERSDKQRGRVLRRRLAWLLVFGVTHGFFIWYGDILVTYALSGFVVLFARSWGVRTLLVGGALLVLLSLALMSAFAFVLDELPSEKLAALQAQTWSPPADELARIRAAYQGGLVSAWRENMATWVQFFGGGLSYLLIRTVGVMMIGMALFKLGFLSGKAPAWAYAATLAIGTLAIGVIGWQAWLNARADFEFTHMQARGAFANTALSIFASIGYASLFVLLVKARARFVTDPLSAVGRMAFTNYIAQSLIMTTIFWGGRGFGLFGEVDRPTLWAIVLAIWALQLLWSPIWLSRFQMGPLEWVWRRLSFGQPIMLAKQN
jgi:uncharacterized protein